MITTTRRIRMMAELMKIAWVRALRRTVCGVGGERCSDVEAGSGRCVLDSTTYLHEWQLARGCTPPRGCG